MNTVITCFHADFVNMIIMLKVMTQQITSFCKGQTFKGRLKTKKSQRKVLAWEFGKSGKLKLSTGREDS